MRVGIIVGAAALGLVGMTPPVQSQTDVELTATVLMMRGVNATTLDEGIMNDVLHGRFRQDTKVAVEWRAASGRTRGRAPSPWGSPSQWGPRTSTTPSSPLPGRSSWAGIGELLVVDEVMKRLAAEHTLEPMNCRSSWSVTPTEACLPDSRESPCRSWTTPSRRFRKPRTTSPLSQQSTTDTRTFPIDGGTCLP